MAILDRFGRPLRSLRVSVTDRCNLRCQYCMPEADYAWLPHETLLSFEEIADARRRVLPSSASTACGSPAASRCCAATSRRSSRLLAAQPAIRRSGADDQRRAAGAAGGRAPRRRPAPHHRQPRHAATARASRPSPGSTSIAAVLAGIDAAAAPASTSLKIDTVVMRGVNDDELATSSSSAGRSAPKCGSSSTWTSAARRAGRQSAVVSRREMLAALERALRRHHCRSTRIVSARGSLSACPTARSSASSPRRPSRSASPAIAAGSPPTASG